MRQCDSATVRKGSPVSVDSYSGLKRQISFFSERNTNVTNSEREVDPGLRISTSFEPNMQERRRSLYNTVGVTKIPNRASTQESTVAVHGSTV